jgi:vacuolar-type H+-ATPase subunit E/Vma4
VSLRENYQEAILDLFQQEEDYLGQLPSNERYRRQQILIQLLRATSEDEYHLAMISLEDLSEIISHVHLLRAALCEPRPQNTNKMALTEHSRLGRRPDP